MMQEGSKIQNANALQSILLNIHLCLRQICFHVISWIMLDRCKRKICATLVDVVNCLRFEDFVPFIENSIDLMFAPAMLPMLYILLFGICQGSFHCRFCYW